MSGMFKSKTTVPSYENVYDPMGGLRNSYQGWLQGQVGKAGPTYTGEMVAPLTGQQNQSLTKLQSFADQGKPATTQAAEKQVTDTLAGNYDPTSSPYYQAVKAAAATNLEDTNKQIASEAGGAGQYWTGARLEQQQKAGTATTEALNTMLGQLSQQERQNQLSMVPQAAAMGQAEQQLPLQQSTALQTLGALPQTQQQNIDTALQQQWQQSNIDYPQSMAQLIQSLLGLSTGSAGYGVVAQQGQQPSLWDSTISPGIMGGLGALLLM